MFNKSQLEGILLSVAKPEVHISRSQHTNIGYRVRIRVNIRGCEDFLLGVQRTLAQNSIKSKYKEKEHGSRPRPILTISSIVNLWLLCELIPDLPDCKGVWVSFKEIVKLIDGGEQHTLEGLERIMELKGVI